MATIEEYMESAEFIKEKIGAFRPEIALVLGSGLGYVGDEVEEPVIVPYHEIPHFQDFTQHVLDVMPTRQVSTTGQASSLT